MANEKRLIDANRLKAELRKSAEYHEKRRLGYFSAIDHINEQPTVDAVEVVHGHWNVEDYDSGEPDGYAAFIEVHCSECGYELGAESGQYGWAYGDPFPLNYCPNCGAKMDGDGNG